MSKSRTAKSVKNSSVALIMYFISLILQFYSRKIFLEYLGTEVLGLNTTATNLLQFLNLAELGISTAVGYTLYRPIKEQDNNTIIEIISLQGWIYKRVAIWLICGGCILSAFFPWIFSKMKLPLWYAYVSFGVLMFSSLLGYFVNYKQVLLSADQKDYKIQCSYRLSQLVKVLLQILGVVFLPNGYVAWLVIEAVFAIISSYVLNKVLYKTYPFLLNKAVIKGKDLLKKYKEITNKIKQLFFHKIGSFVLSQTSPIIIYAYASLSLVAIYGNYQLIINGVITLLAAIFNSLLAGVGNLIATKNENQIRKVFFELMSIRFAIISTFCFTVYMIATPFVKIWIGNEYVLSNTTLLLMVCVLFIQGYRYTIDAFVNGYGLFSDIWAPVVEGGLNISLSIILGKFYGLNGIISGVLISLAVMMLIWKPYYLLSRRLPDILNKYIRSFLSMLVIGIGVAIGLSILGEKYISNGIASFYELFLFSFFCAATYFICITGGLLCVNEGMLNFIKRFIK